MPTTVGKMITIIGKKRVVWERLLNLMLALPVGVLRARRSGTRRTVSIFFMMPMKATATVGNEEVKTRLSTMIQVRVIQGRSRDSRASRDNPGSICRARRTCTKQAAVIRNANSLKGTEPTTA